MIKIAVVDDNPEILDLVTKQVHEFYLLKKIECSITPYMRSENLLYDLEDDLSFDLFILDIEMPGYSGMQVAKKIKDKDLNQTIIFVTSFLSYALEGYKLDVFRYVQKNKLSEDLPEALHAFTACHYKIRNNYFIIQTNSRYEKILLLDIVFLYKSGKNTIFVCDDFETKTRGSLKDIFSKINSSDFIFIERGYIVNIKKIRKIVNFDVMMTNNESLRIGRSYYKKVKKDLTQFWSDSL